MKSIVLIFALLLPFSLSAKVVHLDCTGTLDRILGENVHGKSSNSVGDTYGPYLVDIDFDKNIGRLGGWSPHTYSVDPNDPKKIMTIGDTRISFGIMPPDGKIGFMINREDLSFFAMIAFGATQVINGKCKLIEKRKEPKRAF